MSASKLTTLTSPIRRYTADVVRYVPVAIFPALFAIGGTWVFTRTFSPAEYGLFSLALAVLTPIITLVVEWVAQPLGRFYAEYEHKGQLDVYYQIVRLFLLAVLVCATVGAAATVFVLWGSGVHNRWLVSGAVATLLAQSLHGAVVRILPARLNAVAYQRSSVLIAGLTIGIPVALIALGVRDIAILIWGTAVAVTVTIPYVYREAGVGLRGLWPSLSAETQTIFVRFARYGTPMTLWFFASGLLSIGDRFVIQMLLGSTAVGIYSVNYNLTAQAVGLANAALLVASFPILSYQWAQGQHAQARKTMTQITDLYLVFSLGMLGGTAVIGQSVVRLLLGPQFHEGYVVLLPALAGVLIWGVSVIGHKSLELAERTHLMVAAALAAALLNIVLNIVLIPRMGYIAAAYTTCASYLFYAVLVWCLARGQLPWDLPLAEAAGSALAALGAAALASAVAAHLSGGEPLGQSLVGGVVFVAGYGVGLATIRYKDVTRLLHRSS